MECEKIYYVNNGEYYITGTGANIIYGADGDDYFEANTNNSKLLFLLIYQKPVV